MEKFSYLFMYAKTETSMTNPMATPIATPKATTINRPERKIWNWLGHCYLMPIKLEGIQLLRFNVFHERRQKRLKQC